MRPAGALLLIGLCGCSGLARVDELEAGLSVCAKGAVTNGVDVSHYEGTIIWPSVKAAGYAFAIMKATEQTSFIDPTFAANWKQAGDAGIIRGAYHFFRPSYDPIQQADFFVQTAGVPAAGDLPPTIDLEVTDSLTGPQVAQGALQFLQRVEQKTGRKPIIYTSARVFTLIGDPSGFDSYTLWVANWQVMCPKIPSPTWSDWTMWQNASTGTVPGITGNVDVDQFNGSLDDLHAFVGMTMPPAASDGGGTDAGGDDAGGEPPGVGSGGGEPGPPAMQAGGCSMTSEPATAPLWLLLYVGVFITRRRLTSSPSA